MNWLEKIRDNFIPIEKLYNKNFYTEKVAALLLELPLADVNGETSLVLFLSKASKAKLLSKFKKQGRLIAKITKQMDKFRMYDPNSRRYIQTVVVKYGHGIEYLILGEILEKQYGFNFPYTPRDIQEDGGKSLCENIELILNRLPDFYKDRKLSTLKNIRQMVEQRIKEEQLVKAENE